MASSGVSAPLFAFDRKIPNVFSISFQSGVRGLGLEVSSERSCAGYAGNLSSSSASVKTDLRVGGLPRRADCFICSGAVAQTRKSKAASEFLDPFGIAMSQLPISACPGLFAPGRVVKAISPGTRDRAGSLKALIHAGQFMDMAADP